MARLLVYRTTCPGRVEREIKQKRVSLVRRTDRKRSKRERERVQTERQEEKERERERECVRTDRQEEEEEEELTDQSSRLARAIEISSAANLISASPRALYELAWSRRTASVISLWFSFSSSRSCWSCCRRHRRDFVRPVLNVVRRSETVAAIDAARVASVAAAVAPATTPSRSMAANPASCLSMDLKDMAPEALESASRVFPLLLAGRRLPAGLLPV